MLFSMEFTEDEIRKEPCVMCGQPSVVIYTDCLTQEKAFTVPEGNVRVNFFGLCENCRPGKAEFTKQDFMKLAENMLRQDALALRSSGGQSTTQ